MTEEVTPVEAPEVDTAQIEAATKLLLDKGFNVMDSKALGKRLEKERKGPSEDLAKAQAELDKLKEKASSLRKFKQEIEDKDRSEIEIWENRQKEWEVQDAAQKVAIETARSDVEAQKTRMKDIQIEQKIGQLMVGARTPELSMMWAKAKVKGLGVSDDGVLTYTEPTGVMHEGPAAEKIFSDWWAKQEDHRDPRTAGPPTKGSPAPPPNRPDEFTMPDSGDLGADLAAVEAYERRQRAQ